MNSNGQKVVSNVVTLRISDKFEIMQQPESFCGSMDDVARFSVLAGGTNLSYQWQMSSDGINDWETIQSTVTATKARLNLKVTSATAGKYYRCQLTNNDGKILTSRKTVL